VQVGDLLLIKPGAKVPVDALVDEGISEVDQSVVTGESLPVSKAPGDELIGGSINKNGTMGAYTPPTLGLGQVLSLEDDERETGEH
jgi:Cu2+-exporting ATPase